jgi:hypothetical protein
MKVCGGLEGVYEDRFTALYAIPQTVKNLVSGWMLEVPAQGNGFAREPVVSEGKRTYKRSM